MATLPTPPHITAVDCGIDAHEREMMDDISLIAVDIQNPVFTTAGLPACCFSTLEMNLYLNMNTLSDNDFKTIIYCYKTTALIRTTPTFSHTMFLFFQNLTCTPFALGF